MCCCILFGFRASNAGGSRGQWTFSSMAAAVRDVLVVGTSKKAAAKRHGVPRATLQRHVRNAEKGLGVEKRLGRRSILSPEQENELASKLIDMEARLYGLTTEDVRKLVFQFCEMNSIKHPFSQEKRMAGKKWLSAYFQRHKDLSVRLPERTSLSRAVGFNKPKVDMFFDTLGSTLFKADGSRHVPPENMYNVDETGFTICQKSQRIVGKKGKKTVGIMSSAEKGKNVTVICCVSAAGNYVPPMFIFPRVRVRPDLLDRGPTGAVARANKSGWITEALFEEWFDHFINYVQPKSRSQPTLLLADGHCSHINNLSLIEKARDNNVILLIFPSHCTHKLQPLDVAVYKSLKWHYDKEVSLWLRNHPGRAVTERDIAELFSMAYGRAATSANSASGFEKTGIHPFNPRVFGDEDFVASLVTDDSGLYQAETTVVEHAVAASSDTIATGYPGGNGTTTESVPTTDDGAGQIAVQIYDSAAVCGPDLGEIDAVDSMELASSVTVGTVHSREVITADTEALNNDGSVIKETAVVAGIRPNDTGQSQTEQLDSYADTSGTDGVTTTDTIPKRSSSFATFEDILPTPKAPCRSSVARKRKAFHATIVTSSPFKQKLQQIQEEKQSKEHALKQKECTKKSKNSTAVQKRTSSKVAAKRSTSKTGGPAEKATTHTEDTDPELNNVDRTPCMFCEVLYCESSVRWFRCKFCFMWACGDCAAVGRKKVFVCSNCK